MDCLATILSLKRDCAANSSHLPHLQYIDATRQYTERLRELYCCPATREQLEGVEGGVLVPAAALCATEEGGWKLPLLCCFCFQSMVTTSAAHMCVHPTQHRDRDPSHLHGGVLGAASLTSLSAGAAHAAHVLLVWVCNAYTWERGGCALLGTGSLLTHR